jgi:hypothetical protein
MATHADLQALQGVKEEYEYGFHDEEKPLFKTERITRKSRNGCASSATRR